MDLFGYIVLQKGRDQFIRQSVLITQAGRVQGGGKLIDGLSDKLASLTKILIVLKECVQEPAQKGLPPQGGKLGQDILVFYFPVMWPIFLVWLFKQPGGLKQ